MTTSPILHDHSEDPPAPSEARESDLPMADARPADEELAPVLGTTPLRMTLDKSGAGIAHWKHNPLHYVIQPMTHHVIMTYSSAVLRMRRRSGRSPAIGTLRPGFMITQLSPISP